MIRDRVLFWCLIAGQAVGSQVLIWGSLPIYHRLKSGGPGASGTEFVLGLAAVILMQACHWPALAIRRRLGFRRNTVLGHVLICIGELSLFFTAALTTLILFDRFGELAFRPYKMLVLVAIVFAVSSYKYQIMSLGDRLIDDERHAAGGSRPSGK